MARSNAAFWPRHSQNSQEAHESQGAHEAVGEHQEREVHEVREVQEVHEVREVHEVHEVLTPGESGAGGSAREATPSDAAGSPLGGRALCVVWRQAGATVVVPAGAPDPESHRPRLSEDAIERVLAAKREARERGIRRLYEEALAELPPDAVPPDRFIAAIRWDSEFAPRTTNRRQLAETGVDVPAPEELPAVDADIHRMLWTVIYGLARLGIFFTETDGIDDRSMLALLAGRILEDDVGDIPPNGDMSEFIALCSGMTGDPEDDARTDGPVSPDGLQGPFESDEEDDGSWDPYGASAAPFVESHVGAPQSRTTAGRACGDGRGVRLDAGVRAHQVGRAPVRRDHLLPRPYRPGLTCM